MDHVKENIIKIKLRSKNEISWLLEIPVTKLINYGARFKKCCTITKQWITY